MAVSAIQGEDPTIPTPAAEDADTISSPHARSIAERAAQQFRPPAATTTPTYPTIAGYTITGKLGEGGMGIVWRAIQEGTHRPVALKLMSAAGFGSQRARLRFQREVDLTANIEHPHIARVYAGGESDGVYFYAMELIEGLPLDKYVTRATLSRRQILQLMQVVCSAVQYAHQKGVIHRDLKPANIMVDKNGQPRILDFGLAKAIEGDSQQISIDVAAMGTPAYMSPEQAAGKINQLDTRSDVYTLGVILFRLLSGEFPHDTSGSAIAIMKRISEEEPRRLRAIEPRIDKELEALLGKALAREPQRRYGTAGGLAADLERYLNGDPLNAQPPTVAYLLKKKVTKYRMPFTIAALVVAIMLSTAIWAYVSVTREKNVAVSAKQQALVSAALAIVNQKKAETERLAADKRLAESLLNEADARAATEEWPLATTRYRESREAFVHLGMDPYAVDLGLWDAIRLNPAPLVAFPSDQGVAIHAVYLLPDGRTALSGGDSSEIKLWDMATGQLLRTFKKSSVGSVQCLALSANGERLLAGDFYNGMLAVWDFRTGKRLLSWAAHKGTIQSIDISDDGSTALSGGDDTAMRLWDLADGQLIREFRSPMRGSCVHVQFLKGEKTALAVLNYHSPKIYDLQTGKVIRTLEILHYGRCALAPDEQRLFFLNAASQPQVADFESGETLSRPHSNKSPAIDAMAFPESELVVSGNRDGTVRLWNANTGLQLQTLTLDRAVKSISVSPDARTILAGTQRPRERALRPDDDNFFLWRTNSNQGLRRLPIANAHATALSLDGRLVATGMGKPIFGVRVWDVATGVAIPVASPTPQQDIVAIQFIDHQRLLTLSSVRPYIVEITGNGLSRYHAFEGAHDQPATCLALSPDGHAALTGGIGGIIKMWDVDSGKEIHPPGGFKECTGDLQSLAFSPDGRMAISAASTNGDAARERVSLCLWDFAAGRRIGRLRPGRNCSAGAFSPDGAMLATAVDDSGEIEIWDLKSAFIDNSAPKMTLTGHSGTILRMTFIRSGRTLVSAGADATLRFWDMATGRLLRTLAGHTGRINDVAFDGDELATTTSGDGTLGIWDFSQLQAQNELEPQARAARLSLQNDASVSPQHAGAFLALGKWYALRGANDWAVEFLEKARAAGGDVSPLMLARCHWQLGHGDRAVEEFKKAAERNEAPAEYLELCMNAVRAAGQQPSTATTLPSVDSRHDK